MIIKTVLRNKEDYAAFIAKHFKLFNLNLDLCDPTDINLTENQLLKLMEEVKKCVPDILSTLPYIDITIQFSIEDSISIYLYSPYSSNAIIGLSAKLISDKINLEFLFQRIDIRKESIGPEIRDDEFQSYMPGTIVILVVDDELVVRRTLTRWLKNINENFTIIELGNGKEALEYVQSGSQCDLIFMDMQMPFMRGDVACTLMRNFERDNEKIKVPIIFMTASSVIREHLERSGINLAFKKPLNMFTVHAALRYVKSIASYMPTLNSNAPENHPGIFIVSIPTDQKNLFVMNSNQKTPPPEQPLCINTEEETLLCESQTDTSKNEKENGSGSEVEATLEEDESSGFTLTP